MYRSILGATLLSACLVIMASTAMAVDPEFTTYHAADSMVCEDCHVMHSTTGLGADLNPTAVDFLLKKNGTDSCLTCHDENNAATAPYVLNSTGTVTAAKLLAGGDFKSDWGGGKTDGAGTAHTVDNVNAATVVPASTTDPTITLQCSSCHDPHGSSNYRNLKSTVSEDDGTQIGSTITVSAAGEDQGTSGTANSAYKHNVYVGVSADTSGISAWCANCHDDAHSMVLTDGNTVVRHAVDVDIVNVEAGTYYTGTPAGYAAGLPLEDVGGDNAPAAGVDLTALGTWATTDEIMCLTCHKAHGADYDDILRFDPSAVQDGSDTECTGCHAK